MNRSESENGEFDLRAIVATSFGTEVTPLHPGVYSRGPGVYVRPAGALLRSLAAASGGVNTTSDGVSNASGGINTASGGVSTASGGISTASGGVSTASGGVSTASGSTGVALGNYVSDIKQRSRKLFPESLSLDTKEIMDNEHIAGIENDFADLLNIPTDCNFFQFKSEKNWDKEAARSTFSCQKFFNLDLEVLSRGLECLQLYNKITMGKNVLLESDMKKCDEKARKALEKYKDLRENFEKDMEEDLKLSKSFEDLTGIKWEPRKPKVIEPEGAAEAVEEEMDPEDIAPQCGRYWLSHRTELKEKGDDSYLAPSSSSDESLEIWLDTYLDD